MSIAEKLKEILELKEMGALTDAEFEAQKALILSGGAVGVGEVRAGDVAQVAVEAVQTEFDVVLTAVGYHKIKVIKKVREFTRLGLREAKALVDFPPKAVKKAVSKEEAERVKEALEALGASVRIK